MIRLTEEGKRYLEQGLPEKALIDSIKDKPRAMQDMSGLPDSAIAMQWAKKNGWIAVKGGSMELTAAGMEALHERYPLQDALAEVEQGRETGAEFMNILWSRKLVAEAKEAIKIDEVVQLTPELIKSGAWKTAPFRRYDPTAPAPPWYPGKKQAYLAFLDEVKTELIALGFEEMSGPLVELGFYDLDALFVPQDHPARGVHDNYYIKEPSHGSIPVAHRKFLEEIKKTHENGGKSGSRGWHVPFTEREAARLVLRSQGTALSARWLMKQDINIPGAYFAIARCYRPEKLDATHLTEFNQLEGIVLGEGGNFRRVLGLLSEFARKIAGTDKVKFRPAYFPFTEPSVQGMVWHPKLRKWIEMLPAGMFRPELTTPLGIKVPVMAWGIGIDRLFMIREGITDIRQLFSQDLGWLRSTRVA